jgi:hypothetical protein
MNGEEIIEMACRDLQMQGELCHDGNILRMIRKIGELSDQSGQRAERLQVRAEKAEAEVERLRGIIDRLHKHAIRHWVKKDQFYHMIEFIAIVDEAKDEGREVQ